MPDVSVHRIMHERSCPWPFQWCTCDTPTIGAIPDPARYLDLDSEDAVERLAEALAKADAAVSDGWPSDPMMARAILAALRNPTADEG